jgi:hypothetical protein
VLSINFRNFIDFFGKMVYPSSEQRGAAFRWKAMEAITESQSDLEKARTRRVTVRNAARSYGPLGTEYPPIMSLKQAAKLALLATSTLKRHVSEGKYKFCVSRKKPLRFWRDKFVVELMR